MRAQRSLSKVANIMDGPLFTMDESSGAWLRNGIIRTAWVDSECWTYPSILRLLPIGIPVNELSAWVLEPVKQVLLAQNFPKAEINYIQINIFFSYIIIFLLREPSTLFPSTMLLFKFVRGCDCRTCSKFANDQKTSRSLALCCVRLESGRIKRNVLVSEER